MSKRFQNKYLIDFARLKSWNYGWNGAYFITICTKNRESFFGKVSNQKMIFSDIGNIANQCWNSIPMYYPFVRLGEFIVMPNHVHGIIIIDKSNHDTVQTQHLASQKDIHNEAQGIAPVLQNESKQMPQNRFGPQSNNLASIVRGFKIGVTKNARKIRPDFKWQPRFHDHIIRNEESFQRISEYIRNNPVKWTDDKFYLK
ncbi:MAG: transposase [Balneolaceae bacterium]